MGRPVETMLDHPAAPFCTVNTDSGKHSEPRHTETSVNRLRPVPFGGAAES
jgi:hypothetical protein